MIHQRAATTWGVALGFVLLAGSACQEADPAPASSGGPGPSVTSSAAGGSAGTCVGVKPEADAFGASPGPIAQGGNAAGGGEPSDIGAPAPSYQLDDFQPLSCGFGATYGLDDLRGQVVVVNMWAGWCHFCQGQAVKMEEMRLELESQGFEVSIVGSNEKDAAAEQGELTSRGSYALWQDTTEVDSWRVHHNGAKDDILIYDKDGVLADKLSPSGERFIDMTSPLGWDNVWDAIVKVHEGG